MATKTEGMHTAEFLISEAPGYISRDAAIITVPANTTLAPGTVLGQLSATSKWVPYDDAWSDGRETVDGVLFEEAANDTAAPIDIDGVVINFCAEVRAADLAWGAGVDETGGTADLKALGIKAR